MFNVRLAGGHLYGKQLFTWLSLVVSLMASFVLSFFPLDVLDEIWYLVESVSEGFVTYSLYTFLSELSCIHAVPVILSVKLIIFLKVYQVNESTLLACTFVPKFRGIENTFCLYCNYS